MQVKCLVFDRIIRCANAGAEVPKAVAGYINSSEEVFNEFFAYLKQNKLTTAFDEYVKKRIVSRQECMIIRCTDHETYPDYYRKGIKVAEVFAHNYINCSGKEAYERDQKGRIRLFFAVRAMYYDRQDGMFWIDTTMEIHRINDLGHYEPSNIVLIPKWLHVKIHSWMDRTGNTDSRQYLKEYGYWDNIIGSCSDWQVAV